VEEVESVSLKAIEMQIALPRTHDAGKQQEQLQHRGQIAQSHAAEFVQKEGDLQRSSVIKHEQKGKTEFQKENYDSKDHDDQQEKSRKKKNKKDEAYPEQHPYKGTFIDFSG
jgi:hypothetical protein